MSTSHEVVVLVGNPRPHSRTRAVAEYVASQIPSAPARVLDLAELVAISWTHDAVAPDHPDETAFEHVRNARVLLVATPSYKGTYTGLLKIFFDRFPHLGLDGVIALPLAVAASPDHATATADDLARLLRELGAHVAGTLPLLESQLEHPDLGDAVDLLVRATAA